MAIYEYEAKRLYVKKSDLENALGVSLEGIRTRYFKSEPKEYLKPYNAMSSFNMYDCIALLKGLDPNRYNENRDHDFYVIARAIESSIKSGELANSYGEFDQYGNPEFLLDRLDMEKWAKHYGYKWELPPYNPLQPCKTDEQLKKQNDELQCENGQLKERIRELEQAGLLEINSDMLPANNNTTENYNPTERETHLLMINALAQMLTKSNGNAGKYLWGNAINKKQISEDIAQQIKEALNDPETKTRSQETIRARLNDALKFNEQAD